MPLTLPKIPTVWPADRPDIDTKTHTIANHMIGDHKFLDRIHTPWKTLSSRVPSLDCRHGRQLHDVERGIRRVEVVSQERGRPQLPRFNPSPQRIWRRWRAADRTRTTHS